MSLHLSSPKFIRLLLARPRLVICALVSVIVALTIPTSTSPYQITRLLIGGNVGIYLYLFLTVHLMFGANHEKIKARARQEDEGRFLILALVLMVSILSLAAIVSELAIAKNLHDTSRYAHLALVALTLFSSWSFTQIMFAQHYAHDYYVAEMKDASPGLAFPGKQTPDYNDFLYFSCIIGTSAQTADVSFTTRAMRRTGTVHCIFSFFFNTTLLALTINIASGLL